MKKTVPRFYDLVLLYKQIELDKKESQNELLLRDSNFTQQHSNDCVGTVLAWLHHIQDQKKIHTRQLLERSFVYAIPVLGVFLGSVTMAGILEYDGSQPLNVLAILLLLVGLPWIFFFFSLMSLLPNNRMPIVTSLKEVAHSLNIIRFLQPFPQSIPRQLYRLEIFRLSQFLSVSFFLGVLIYFFYTLTFRDVAFGWSSTFDFSATRVHSLTNSIALPWNTLFPSAVPSLDLIEATRFYKLQTTTTEAALFGHWWPFLFLAIFTYSFIPRLLLYLFLEYRSKQRLHEAFLAPVEVQSLLWRLDPSAPKIQKTTSQSIAALEDQGDFPIPELSIKDAIVLSWGWVLSEPALQQLQERFSIQRYIAFEHSKEKETDIVQSLSRYKPSTLVILVKVWSVPTAEMFDFITLVIQTDKLCSAVRIVPVDPEKLHTDTDQESNLRMWQRKVYSLEDVHVKINRIARQEKRDEQ